MEEVTLAHVAHPQCT